MSDLTISPAARSTLTALASMQDQINALQSRLASGKRVNVPTDNPTSYFLAAGLSSRASAINALMSAITSAQGAVAAANNGITTIKALLNAAQAVANQALQTPQALATATGTNGSAFTTGSTIASGSGSATELAAGDTVTVSDGTTTATYTAANGDTIQTLLNAVNNTANLKVTAGLNASGQLQFSATSNVDITIGGTLSGSGGGTLTGILGLTAGTTAYTTNTVRSQLASQFDSLLGQIDQAASDAGFDGVNLLTGSSSTVVLNETGTANLTLTGSLATSSALGVAAAGNNFQLPTDINAALSNITSALTSLQGISAGIGSTAAVLQTRVDFNKAMADTLNAGADDLTANDPNADSAALLALQTRRQIAITSLSLTRDNDASALRLFGL